MSEPEGALAGLSRPGPQNAEGEARHRIAIDIDAISVEKFCDLHQRGHFQCTDRAIQNFCRAGVDQHHRRNAIRAFVATHGGSQDVCGFYYLCLTSYEHEQVGPAIADQYIILDRVPAIYLGMLGVHTPMDRQGIGTKLLMDAVQRAMAIAENAGVWALTLDATDEETVAYYERFDFERLAPDRLEMYLPISLIKRTFQMEADALVQEDETEAAA